MSDLPRGNGLDPEQRYRESSIAIPRRMTALERLVEGTTLDAVTPWQASHALTRDDVDRIGHMCSV